MTKIRFGTAFPLPSQSLEEVFDCVKVAEKNGFESIWIADHLLMMRPGFVPEAWTVLSAIAMITKRAMLGTCVSDPHRKHPAVFAQILATLDRISNGRAILGIGPGEMMNVTAFGIDFEKPVSKMIESVEMMRLLWKEDRVTYKGEFYDLKNAFLQVKPMREIPVYFGSNSPRTRELTGRVADGWMPFIETPDTYEKHVKEVEDGAKESGRSIDEIDTALLLSTAISEDREEAFRSVNPYRVNWASMPDKFKKAYPEIKFPEIKHDPLTSLNVDITNLARFAALIPKEAVYDFNAVGTEEDCIEQIERYLHAGVRHFALINRGPDPKKTYEIYGKRIIPYFKEEMR
jgi:alkanesulfonate monooxygenase SsuD/methylene tetrahydromethanopterin reductase-like flavin-dependent oxidoreductase (luciferase family)